MANQRNSKQSLYESHLSQSVKNPYYEMLNQSEKNPYSEMLKQSEVNKPIKANSVMIEMVPARNPSGANHCFVNVLIQMLFHAKVFRQAVLKQKDAQSDLFKAIRDLFVKYDELQKNPTPGQAIDVTNMRKKLFELFPSCNLTNFGDPFDVFLNVMTVLHSFQLKEKDLSKDNSGVCYPRCLAHALFSLKMTESCSCLQCGKSVLNAYDNNYYVYEIYTWELLDFSKSMAFKAFHQKLFENAFSVSTILDEFNSLCHCTDSSMKSRKIILKENPPFLMLHLTWDICSLMLKDLCKVYAMLPLSSYNDALFQLEEGTGRKGYELTSIIAFFCGHYVSCTKSSQKNKWLFADDMIIKEFNGFSQLMLHCVRNHYVPIALCYSMSSSDKKEEEHITEKDYVAFLSTLKTETSTASMVMEAEDNLPSISLCSSFTFSKGSFKKRSGVFNRNCSLINSQVSQQAKERPCLYCNQMNSVELLKCQNCKKMIAKNYSIIQETKEERKAKPKPLTGSTLTFQSKGFKSSPADHYKLAQSGYAESLFEDDLPLCETQYDFNDDKTANQSLKESMKETELNPQLAKEFVLNSSIKGLQQSSIISSKANPSMQKINDSKALYKSIESKKK